MPRTLTQTAKGQPRCRAKCLNTEGRCRRAGVKHQLPSDDPLRIDISWKVDLCHEHFYNGCRLGLVE
jgi:hypothetical protein